MSKAVTDTKYYNEIANALQFRIGSDEKLSPPEMAGAVNTVYETGYDSGLYQGESIGETQGRQALEDEILGGAW